MSAQNDFRGDPPRLDSPAAYATAITPSDTEDLSHVSRAIYVGTGGNLTVTMQGGGDAVFRNLPNGSLLPVRVTRVKSTGTTADDLLELH